MLLKKKKPFIKKLQISQSLLQESKYTHNMQITILFGNLKAKIYGE